MTRHSYANQAYGDHRRPKMDWERQSVDALAEARERAWDKFVDQWIADHEPKPRRKKRRKRNPEGH